MSTNNKIKLYSLLTPLSFIYGIVVWIRNILFDWGIFTSEQYSIPIISIGNLSVGGTGKTPHTEYLIQLLIDKYRIAVIGSETETLKWYEVNAETWEINEF